MVLLINGELIVIINYNFFDKALEDINKAIDCGAEDVFIYINRAEINRELKNYDQGKADIKKP